MSAIKKTKTKKAKKVANAPKKTLIGKTFAKKAKKNEKKTGGKSAGKSAERQTKKIAAKIVIPAKLSQKAKKLEDCVKRLIHKGKERGFVTYDGILKEFPTVEEDLA